MGWRAEGKTDTFQLLQVLRVADVDPHGCQLLLPQVHLLQRLLVSGQLIHQCLGLRQRHFLINLLSRYKLHAQFYLIYIFAEL